MDKIDPKLWQLIDAHTAGELPLDPDNPDFLVHVYVEAENDDFSGVMAAGYEVASPLGGTGIITLPISEIESLADHAEILTIYAPRSGQPFEGPPVVHTVEQRSIRLDEGYAVKSHTRPNGSQGEDAIIGIVDSGVNVLHDAFTFKDTVSGVQVRKTRIIAYWAQASTTRRGSTPIWQRNGRLFSENEINAQIAAFDVHGALPPDSLLDRQLDDDLKWTGDSGHGTAVASVAAGSGWTAGPDAVSTRTGIAPAARFIVVSGQQDDLAGIEFCFAKATEFAQPCVVNMSQGNHGQPHNGLSVFSHRLRAMLTQGSPATFRPGRAFVIAAGNEGLDHIHMQLPVPQAKTLNVQVDPHQLSLGCLISSTKPGLRVSLALPGARPVFTAPGPMRGRVSISGHDITIRSMPSAQQHGPDDLPTDTDSHILVQAEIHVTLSSGFFIRPGTWQLKLDPGADPHPEVHIWCHTSEEDSQRLDELPFVWAKEDDGNSMAKEWKRRKEWIHNTIRAEASSREALVVGAADMFPAQQVMSPWRMSSRGPGTDAGRPPGDLKPDLVAPGDNIVVARWRRPKHPADPSSISRHATGTSLAAPAVAGAVALMLSHDPTLNQDDIRTILRASTSHWAQIVNQLLQDKEIDEQNIAGKGLLNIEAAINGVKARVGP